MVEAVRAALTPSVSKVAGPAAILLDEVEGEKEILGLPTGGSQVEVLLVLLLERCRGSNGMKDRDL